jgi:hypothetical protein
VARILIPPAGGVQFNVATAAMLVRYGAVAHPAERVVAPVFVVLGLPEEGKHLFMRPPRVAELRPMVIVPAMPAHLTSIALMELELPSEASSVPRQRADTCQDWRPSTS